MANELELVRLEHTSSGHNKQYTIWIEKVSGGYLVNFNYGKINGNSVSGTKTNTPREWSIVTSMLTRLKTEKIQKGYKVVKSKKPILMVKAPTSDFDEEYVSSPVIKKVKKMKKTKKVKKKKDDDEPQRSLIL